MQQKKNKTCMWKMVCTNRKRVIKLYKQLIHLFYLIECCIFYFFGIEVLVKYMIFVKKISIFGTFVFMLIAISSQVGLWNLKIETRYLDARLSYCKIKFHNSTCEDIAINMKTNVPKMDIFLTNIIYFTNTSIPKK